MATRLFFTKRELRTALRSIRGGVTRYESMVMAAAEATLSEGPIEFVCRDHRPCDILACNCPNCHNCGEPCSWEEPL